MTMPKLSPDTPFLRRLNRPGGSGEVLLVVTDALGSQRIVATDFYQDGGRLPVWELAGNETECMIGYHSVAVIADAYMKGIERRIEDGLDADVPSVLSLFISRWDVAVASKVPPALVNKLGVAIGQRSYKSDDKSRQTPQRLIARKDILTALEAGRTRLGLRLKLSHAQHDALVADASGDSLDAVLCLLQAAWASMQPHHGLPRQVDPLEGWIASAPFDP